MGPTGGRGARPGWGGRLGPKKVENHCTRTTGLADQQDYTAREIQLLEYVLTGMTFDGYIHQQVMHA